MYEEFSSYPPADYGTYTFTYDGPNGHRVLVKFDPTSPTWDVLLDPFEQFLRGIGFQFKMTDHFTLVREKESSVDAPL